MRTTIRLEEELLREAKAQAAASGKTLTQLIDDALRESLGRRKQIRRKPVVLPTSGEGGLQPGVDLNDSSALLDLMERVDDSAGR